MKNTIKLLGIVAFVAAIGFSMAACDNGTGGGGEYEFPAQWRPGTNYTIWRIDQVKFLCVNTHSSEVYKGRVYLDNLGFGDSYKITSMANGGQTIRVKKVVSPVLSTPVTGGSEITLCTNWTVTADNKLILSGCEGVFSVFEGEQLVQDTD